MKKYFFYSDTSKEVVQEGQGRANISELEPLILANVREGKDAAPSPGKELHNQPIAKKLEIHVSSASTKAELKTILSLEFTFSEPIFTF